MSDEEQWARYSAAFSRQILPALLESGVVLWVAEPTTGEHVDLRAATEIGLALLLDKPLLVVVAPGETIGEPLRRAAALVLDDFDVSKPRDQRRLQRAIRALTERTV
jgi:hypothetical protein